METAFVKNEQTFKFPLLFSQFHLQFTFLFEFEGEYLRMIDRIAALCQQKNISITRLEREVNLGRSTIRYWDNHPPAVDKVAKVARYFGVSVDYLIGNTDDPYSHQSERSKIAEALKEVQAYIGQKLATLNQQDLE